MAQAQRPLETILDARFSTYAHTYTPRDLSLYALGVGCGAKDLRWVHRLRLTGERPKALGAAG